MTRRTVRTRRGSRSGTAAVEFALISVAFFSLLLFGFELAFRLYAQIALDYATVRAARLLTVDSSQQLSGNQKQFQTMTFCPLLAPMLNCANVVITLRPVPTDFLTDSQINPQALSGTLTNPGVFNAGQSGSRMLLQVVYLGPQLTWPFSFSAPATLNGVSGSALVSRAPYENDY